MSMFIFNLVKIIKLLTLLSYASSLLSILI
nr:MAG TPA: hypothetical protein [Caudoviricetes sp.]